MGLFRRKPKPSRPPEPVRVDQVARLHAAYDAELDAMDRVDDLDDDEFRGRLRRAGAQIAAAERNSNDAEVSTARDMWPWR